MFDKFSKLKDELSYLTHDFDYVLVEKHEIGFLNDRELMLLTYTNDKYNREIELIECVPNWNKNDSFLYGYFKNKTFPNLTFKDDEYYLSFSRLKSYFKSAKYKYIGTETIEDYINIVSDLSPYLNSDSWINYEKLISHEKEIYVLTGEYKPLLWVDKIVSMFSNCIAKNKVRIKFNPNECNSYQGTELVLTEIETGINFWFSYGWAGRWDEGLYIQKEKDGIILEKEEIMNCDYTPKINELVSKIN